VIAEKAYDSDPLRKRLRQRGSELICPHKKNRVRPATQGWPGTAAVQAALDRRTRQRLAPQLRRLVVRYDR